MKKIIITYPDDISPDGALYMAGLHVQGGYQSENKRKGVTVPHFCWVKSYTNSNVKTYSLQKATPQSADSIYISYV